MQRCLDLARGADHLPSRQPRRDELRVLIHRQDCHPMSRVVRETDLTIDVADQVGERTTARNHEKREVSAYCLDLPEDGVEPAVSCQQPATNLYDRIDLQAG